MSKAPPIPPPDIAAAQPPALAPPTEAALPAGADKGRGALLVSAGILLSRLVGLVRDRALAHYLGNGEVAGVFRGALKIPNFLQNLFGEGALSGSFIPVYAQLLGRGRREEADRVAGAVFGLVSLATAVLVALGIAATPLIVDVILSSADGEKRALAIGLVRILFPGTGLLVVSAWCLGILNSHRRFFLSYAAPVLWNAALIAALILYGPTSTQAQLAVYVAYGAVAGSALQLLVQVPSVLGLLTQFRPSLDVRAAPVRQVLRSFGPVLLGRGVVQISALLDTAIASMISLRALATLACAQTLYLIPVSLFGMAVSASELPEMSRAAGSGDDVRGAVRSRLVAGQDRLAFFVVPSAVAFVLLGDVVGAALYQSGNFTAADSRYLWYLLAGAATGLYASTTGRLYASAFYALQDPRTPLKLAAVRVSTGAVLALGLSRGVPAVTGLPEEVGAVGIALASSAGAWLERVLLRRALEARLGRVRPAPAALARIWGAAFAAGAVGLFAKMALTEARGPHPDVAREWGGAVLQAPALSPVVTAALVLGLFGLVYFGVAGALGVAQARRLVRRVLRR